jgi:protein LTV1
VRLNPGAAGDVGEDEDDDDDIPMPHDIDEKKDRWDCETILST